MVVIRLDAASASVAVSAAHARPIVCSPGANRPDVLGRTWYGATGCRGQPGQVECAQTAAQDVVAQRRKYRSGMSYD